MKLKTVPKKKETHIRTRLAGLPKNMQIFIHMSVHENKDNQPENMKEKITSDFAPLTWLKPKLI